MLNDTFNIENKECFAFIKTINSNKRNFVKGFFNRYKFICCNHATRLDNYELTQIKAKGLIRPDIEFIREKAKRRFLNDVESKYHEFVINTINSFDLSIKREINFNLSKKILTDQSYHYLLFGPESLHPIAHKLNKELKFLNFKDKLSEFGKPFFIKAVVPIRKVNMFWIENIFQYSEYDFEEILTENLEIPLVYHQDVAACDILEIEEYRVKIIDKYNIG